MNRNLTDDAFDPMATISVLYEVLQERQAQVARYGQNRGLENGTGPGTTWLARLSPADADRIEAAFREDYEDYEEEVGEVTRAAHALSEWGFHFEREPDVVTRL